MDEIRENCGILDMTCADCSENCPYAGERQEAEEPLTEGAELEAKTVITKVKKWTGTWPSKCDLCGTDLTQQKNFIDGRTDLGWALMCPICYAMNGTGLGLGKGQKYDSKTLEKLIG